MSGDYSDEGPPVSELFSEGRRRQAYFLVFPRTLARRE